jgi:hypothetical protein
MDRHFLIAISLTVVLPAVAASIEASATCTAQNVRNQGTTGCHAHYQAPPDSPEFWAFADAFATGRLYFPAYRDDYDFGAHATTEAHGFAHSPESMLSASANVTVSLTVLFTTSGPVREGWIDLLILPSAEPGYTGAHASVGPYSGGLWQHIDDGRLPFTLGQPFLVQLESISAPQAFWEGSAGGSNSIGVYFRLWEADLSYPVSFREVVIPEPAGTGAAGALILLFVRLLWRKEKESL